MLDDRWRFRIWLFFVWFIQISVEVWCFFILFIKIIHLLARFSILNSIIFRWWHTLRLIRKTSAAILGGRVWAKRANVNYSIFLLYGLLLSIARHLCCCCIEVRLLAYILTVMVGFWKSSRFIFAIHLCKARLTWSAALFNFHDRRFYHRVRQAVQQIIWCMIPDWRLPRLFLRAVGLGTATKVFAHLAPGCLFLLLFPHNHCRGCNRARPPFNVSCENEARRVLRISEITGQI